MLRSSRVYLGAETQSLRSACQCRCGAQWSSRPQIQSARAFLPPSQRRTFSSSLRLRDDEVNPERTFVLDGKTYTRDSWTNVSSSIINSVNSGRALHQEEDHPITITRRIIESVFQSPEYVNFAQLNPVVTTQENFDDLGFPKDHPGRSKMDTYYIDENHVLRTHTSAHQLAHFRSLKEQSEKTGQKGYTLIADVYRRDAIDKSHYPIFHQMEGARVWPRTGDASHIVQSVADLPTHTMKVEDPNPTYHEGNPLQETHTAAEVEAVAAHLKRNLELVVREIFTRARAAGFAEGPGATEPLQVRWIEAYFPFTTPSWELEVFWQGEWLELLGCGVVKQSILNNAGLNDHIGWAFGVGIERVAMLLFNVPDIRLFRSTDSRFTSQFQKGKVSPYIPFSKYPPVTRDISFWTTPSPSSSSSSAVSSATEAAREFHENTLMEIVRDNAGDKVESVTLVDEFTHPKTQRRSCCYRIVYRSLEKTLTKEEVLEMHGEVEGELIRRMGIEIR